MTHAERDAKFAITCVGNDNPASFLAIRKANFKRFVQRSDKWRLFRCTSTWQETNVELPRPPRPDKPSEPSEVSARVAHVNR
jgi:hypothetical protein